MAVQAGAVHELLCDTRSIVPGIDELHAARGGVPGCGRPRPTTRRASAGPPSTGSLAATGHARNGILLAPLSAAAVASLLARRPVAPLVRALAPAPA